MKKLLSLILVLCLCLCALPVVAEETTVETATEVLTIHVPITVADYQAAYTEMMQTLVADIEITWNSVEAEDGQIVWTGVIDNSFVGVMLLEQNGMVSEIAAMLKSELTEDALLSFLSIAGYTGAALMYGDGVTADEACSSFINELYTVFTAMLNGEEVASLCGLPCGISISPSEDGENVYECYFVLQLTTEAAE